ncbi:DUF86 domain-containing protein, partial [Candidatus Poribacteria bacterium]|nr:DUF86 domain-containing protein [Candidatus Poribacteria bacterium]
MSKFDLIRINKIIYDIEKFSKALKDRQIGSIEDLKNEEKYYAVSMILFSIINRAIDLGDEIVAALNIGIPSTYRDIFFLLRKNDYISVEMFNELNTLIYDRNLLSHEYQDFDEMDIFDIMQRVNVVNSFVDKVKELVKNGSD